MKKGGHGLRHSVLALFAAIVVASGVAVGVAQAETGADVYWQVVDNASEDRFKADEG
jgi:hypothetical protein